MLARMRLVSSVALSVLALGAALPAQAFTADHLFVGVTGGGVGMPVPGSLATPTCDSFGNCGYPYFGSAIGGVEIGVDSDYGWQLRLHGFTVMPVPSAFDRLEGATLDLRYVIPTGGDRAFQPYLSIGGGAFGGSEQNSHFVGGIFELGFGARYLFFDHLYVGGDAEWIDLYGGSVEGALGWEF